MASSVKFQNLEGKVKPQNTKAQRSNHADDTYNGEGKVSRQQQVGAAGLLYKQKNSFTLPNSEARPLPALRLHPDPPCSL